MTSAQAKDVLEQALSLDKDAKLLVLQSLLPFYSSDLVGALTEPLMSAAKARDASLVNGIVMRLLKAGVTSAQAAEVLKQALSLDEDAKLLVLLSGLPFDFTDCEPSTQETKEETSGATSGRLAMQEHLLSYISNLPSPACEYVLHGLPLHTSTRRAFVEAFCQQAELGNHHVLSLLEKRLFDLPLTSDEAGGILDGALSLPRDAKLAVLLSKPPFVASQLVEALTEPLLSAAKAGDASLADRIVRRLLQAGVTGSQTSGILAAACKLDLAAKLVILLSPLPFCSVDLVEALRDPLLSAADARSVKVVQSIARRLLRASVEATQTAGILEEAGKLKPSARLILLLSDLPFVASPSLHDALTRLLLFFAKQNSAQASAIMKLAGSKLSASGIKPADADSILCSNIITGTTAQLRVLTSGLFFESDTVRRLVPDMASSLVEAAARNDVKLVQEAERVFHHCGIRAAHTSSFLERARYARCYSFIVHSTLPFEPKVLVWSLAEAYLQELVEGTDYSENEFAGCGYCSASDIELALSRAGVNQDKFLACVLLLAADKLPPDAPVIRSLLDRLVNIGITMPVGDFLMEEIKPELRTLLFQSGMSFSKAALGRVGINRH